MDFDYRILSLEEVRILVQWAAEESWNPSPHEADVFYSSDPNGFVGFFVGNELIAGGAIISYNQEFGFMGLFIVKPEYRAKGYGKALWYRRRDELIARLKPGASIGMDGVVPMQDFYSRGGFQLAFKDERYEKIGSSFSYSTSIREANPSDLPTILAYDETCFGFQRIAFMQAWLSMPDSKTFLINSSGKLSGFCHIRKVLNGYKIGPLFADNLFYAEELYRACLNYGKNEPVFLDIPLNNPDAINLVRNFQAKYVFECARMYYGPEPNLPWQKVFGITSFELG